MSPTPQLHFLEQAEAVPNPAVAAIEYVLAHPTDSPIEFLNCWMHGDFSALRNEWEDVPEAVFVGADPTISTAPQQAEAVPPTRAEAAAEILQYQLGWTYHDGEWIEDKAATETLRQQAEAVPPGYVLVPVEPTEQMKAAAWAAYDSNHDRVMAAVWKAMIDAAIAQQKGARHE